MRLAAGFDMLTISATIMGRPTDIYPALLHDETAVVLIDTGYPGQLPLLLAQMELAGVPLDRLTTILLTHQDLDHIGSLSALLEAAPQRIEVLANALEVPYIQGEKPLVKVTPEAIARAMASLPPEMTEQQRQAFQAALQNPSKARVDRTVEDGEELPYAGGVVVIDTPGHTPGHICLYHLPSKTLLAADALQVRDGQLVRTPSEHDYDARQAAQSLRRLARYDIARVICYHGGLYTAGDVNARIAELASEG